MRQCFGMIVIPNLALPWHNLRRHGLAFGLAGLVISAAMVYPSDMKRDYSLCRAAHYSGLVQGTEKYLRHANALLPIATVVVLRDWKGAGQLAGVVVAGIAASHGPKRLLNDVTVMGTRLGQRPSGFDTRHNMPSGHSTLASAGGCFMARRYSLWFALLCLPVTGLTMYARVMLEAHTISAVLAGGMIGAAVAVLFTAKWRRAQGSVIRATKPRFWPSTGEKISKTQPVCSESA